MCSCVYVTAQVDMRVKPVSCSLTLVSARIVNLKIMPMACVVDWDLTWLNRRPYLTIGLPIALFKSHAQSICEKTPDHGNLFFRLCGLGQA